MDPLLGWFFTNGFSVVVLLFSAVLHEVAHGAMALRLGDPTAKYAGRLTLNPLKHLDPFGSVLLPLLLILVRSPILFGYALPVPYNPSYFKNPKWGSVLVGFAGPATNILLAVVLGIGLRIAAGMDIALPPLFPVLIFYAVLLNLFLAFFNLIPIPPLDGSKLLLAVFPAPMLALQEFLNRLGVFALALLFPVLILVFAPLVSVAAVKLAVFIIGSPPPLPL